MATKPATASAPAVSDPPVADPAPAVATPQPVVPNPATPTLSSNDKRGDIIAYAAMGMLFYIVTLIFIVVVMKVEVSPVMMTLVSVVVTAVTAGAATVLNFQFGSSKGSQDKNATIAAQPESPTPQS